jgi:hypothetical protein
MHPLSWLLICCFLAQPLWGQEELPFWRQKAKVFKQIKERRKIVVSVKLQPEGGEKKVRITGAGAVNVPLYFAVEQIQRFEQLPKVSSYFKKVTHDKEKKEVYFFMQALGTQVRFIQKYQWGVQTPEKAQMDWLVTWGRLKGMVGHYKLSRLSTGQTEITIWAHLKKEDIPIPDFLLNFTLEVIAEKVAQKMRTFIENNYREAKRVQEQYGKK